MVVKQNYKCLELSQNSSLLSQDCQALLQPICEADCSHKDPCVQPSAGMFQLHGRWIANFFADDGAGKTFNEIKAICQNWNSEVVFAKELRDLWSPNWVVKKKGGPNKEMYIGLDPNSLTRACTAKEWVDNCEGLRWLDGTPYERRVATWGVETYGQTSVGCFILKLNPSGTSVYIRGVNDCNVKRSAACVSSCLYPRCPIPRTLEHSENDHDEFKHNEGDQVRLVFLQSLML
ncbi:uncharacterized protein LOC131880891 [Tigriopus californicus]|uniref:uncharacterized protein LOC131880891 n=1 Tax=Tigriopus californicus TaxID=6832 RepID=UPI0027DA8F35|nr:uncharacterized protein LOC131880891 [Tigriopus californicus]